ncbi:beta-ketoacyl-[acyl-carrier-protein] synthase family protein [Planctomycetota bacterium]
MTQASVAITGMGAVTPLGLQTQDLWDALCAGRSGISRITAFDPSGFPSQIAGQVPDYKLRDYIPKTYRKAAKLMCRDIELAVMAANQALRQCGLNSPAIDPENVTLNAERVAVNIGASLITCDLEELAPSVASCMDGDRFSPQKYGRTGIELVTPLWLLKYLPNMLACHISILHDLQGPSNSITCAEVSGHLALSEASQIIQRGDADMALAGGAEAKVNAHTILRQNLIGRATEQGNDTPETAYRPFAADATGAVFGEGAAILVLENLDMARKRGATIVAELAGTGQSISLNPDYRHLEPDGKGIQIAVEKAMADADIGPDDLDLVIPHGMAIPADDSAEAQGLAAALGTAVKDIAVLPTKGLMSNTGAACGAVDTIVAALALQNGQIPAACNCIPRATDCALNIIQEPQSRPLRYALSCSYTYGGHTAAVVLRNPHVD